MGLVSGTQCPSCNKSLRRGQVSCPCGWHLPAKPDRHDAARAHYDGFFKSLDHLKEHESGVTHEQTKAQQALFCRKAEIDAVPPHRQWAKKILIREEAGDRTVTVAALEMARSALGIREEQPHEETEAGANG
jgi:hypothetical protein